MRWSVRLSATAELPFQVRWMAETPAWMLPEKLVAGRMPNWNAAWAQAEAWEPLTESIWNRNSASSGVEGARVNVPPTVSAGIRPVLRVWKGPAFSDPCRLYPSTEPEAGVQPNARS